MSIEYFSPTAINTECAKKVIDKLRTDARYHILQDENAVRLLLRFTRIPPREKWPEDAELNLGNGIYVAFHSSEKNDQQGLLELLEETIGRCGHVVEFTEG